VTVKGNPAPVNENRRRPWHDPPSPTHRHRQRQVAAGIHCVIATLGMAAGLSASPKAIALMFDVDKTASLPPRA
jgi:hypothetical protein